MDTATHLFTPTPETFDDLAIEFQWKWWLGPGIIAYYRGPWPIWSHFDSARQLKESRSVIQSCVNIERLGRAIVIRMTI